MASSIDVMAGFGFVGHMGLGCCSPMMCRALQIAVGGDADLIIADADNLEIRHVFANGQHMKTPEWTRGGFFEHGQGIRKSNMQPVALKHRSFTSTKLA